MEAVDRTLEQVLNTKQQWVIPVYQRNYAWETRDGKQIPRLWADIEAGAEQILNEGRARPRTHFVGAMIYEDDRKLDFSYVPNRYVIDGQQRLTTIKLFLAALRDVALEHEAAGVAKKAESYLFNRVDEDDPEPERYRHRLWSGQRDRGLYTALVDGGLAKARERFPDHFKTNGRPYKNDAPRMLRAYDYFVEAVRDYVDAYLEPDTDDDSGEAEWEERDARTTLTALMTATLHAFHLVVINLGPDDDARGIFASLNGFGQPLLAFDLVRNDVFQRAIKAEVDEQRLYREAWSELEGEFWDKEVSQGRLKAPRCELFLNHFLTAVHSEEIATDDMLYDYQEYLEEADPESIRAEVDTLVSYAKVYRRLEEPVAGTPEHRLAEFLKVWDVSTMHPVALRVGQSGISDEDKRSIYRTLESYILRRTFAHMTPKNYNKVATALLKRFDEDGVSVETFEDALSAFEGDASRKVTDTEFREAVLELPQYGHDKKRLRHVFWALEMHIRDGNNERVSFDPSDLHVEHILPQSWAEHWTLPDGSKVKGETLEAHYDKGGSALTDDQRRAMRERERAKNTLGNLTVLTDKLNPSVGNRGWAAKCSDNGIGRSLLELNASVVRGEYTDGDKRKWDEAAIAARSGVLADALVHLWPS